MKCNPDSAAFPVHPEMEHESVKGVTKLEYFAGEAMKGLCANAEVDQTAPKIAAWSVEQALALIAELNKE